jgi:hypothetical protein
MFNMGVMQAARMLTTPKATEALLQDAKTRGPAPAIAESVKSTLQVVQQAAAGAKVQMTPDVIAAASTALAQLLVVAMVNAGFAPDPQALMGQVQQAMQGQQAAPSGQPQQPPAVAATQGMLAMGGA